MHLTLEPMIHERFLAWMSRCVSEYARDLVAAGVSDREADRNASETLRQAFPNNAPTRDNAVFDLVHGSDGVVGYLWIGRDRSGDETSWWIWDILIEAEHRGKGYGRQAMHVAETHARANGGRSLGLNVFGHNTAALRLYETSGYEVTAVKMRKSL